MARFAVVRAGKVENIVELNDPAGWPAPTGATLVAVADQAEPGGTYDGQKFSRAPAPASNPRRAEYAAAVSLADKVDVLARTLGLA